MAKVVERLKNRLAMAPLDLTSLLNKLAARDSGQAPLKWIRASLGASMRVIAVDDVVYFQAEDKYTKVATADGEALIRKVDQGALRGARPRCLLADPSRHHRQPPGDRPCRSRLARSAGDRVEGAQRKTDRQPHVCAPFQGDVARTPRRSRTGVNSR
jgi:hypothetical protein